MRAVAVELDALGDTRPLWEDWVASASVVLGLSVDLPRDRGEAARLLDASGGNWRSLLERFCEDRAPAYLRRDAAASAALRRLASDGVAVGIYTDAPRELARVALAQLGAERRAAALETGVGALDRLLERLGDGTVVVRSRDELRAAGAESG
jgi:phosphoglycolate phosphatase-like HAD superfamily hydrolase